MDMARWACERRAGGVSSPGAPPLQTFTFTSASDSVAAEASRLNITTRSTSPAGKARVGFFAANTDTSTGTATVAMYLVQKNGNSGAGRIVAVFNATVTATDRRDNLADSASGDYVATVAWDVSSGPSVDLAAAMVDGKDEYELRFACTALDTITSLEFHFLGTDNEV